MNPGKRVTKRAAATNAWHPTPRRVDAAPMSVAGGVGQVYQTWGQDQDVGCFCWRESWPRGADGTTGGFISKLPAAGAYIPNEWWGIGVGAGARSAALQTAIVAVEAQAMEEENPDAPEQLVEMATASANRCGISIKEALRLSAQATRDPMAKAARTRRLLSLRVFRLPRLLNSCVHMKLELQSISDSVLTSGNALLRTLFGEAAEILNKSEVRSKLTPSPLHPSPFNPQPSPLTS